MKAGWKTTEFWVALAQVLVGFLLAWFTEGNNTEATVALGSGAVTGSAYAISRAKVKAAVHAATKP